MGRKRLLAILTATVLTAAIGAGPAAALEVGAATSDAGSGIGQATEQDATVEDAVSAIDESADEVVSSEDTSLASEETSTTSAETASGEDEPEVTVPVPGAGEVTVSAEPDQEQMSLTAGVDADLAQEDLGVEADPSVEVGLSPDGPALDVDGGVSVQGEELPLGELTEPLEDGVNGDQAAEDDTASAPEVRDAGTTPTTTAAAPDRPFAGPTPPSTPAPRSFATESPSDAAGDAGSADAEVIDVPQPEVADPVVALDKHAALPFDDGSGPQALLRILATLMVAGSAGLWGRVRASLEAR